MCIRDRWDAPGSEALNLSQGLVQRICSRPGNEYKDVAIYRQGCRQTEAEKRLLRIVENEAVKSKKMIERKMCIRDSSYCGC